MFGDDILALVERQGGNEVGGHRSVHTVYQYYYTA